MNKKTKHYDISNTTIISCIYYRIFYLMRGVRMDLSSNKVSNSLILILLVSLSSLSSHLSGLVMALGYLSIITIIFVKKKFILM
ncbi:hypothetical protein [Apilactobacillus ozensis]|uniref:hypothetical protein n=1 Tax=Apilactobacillus ozensis TaxID=866801 RepID=UPI000AD7B4FB|nr:hypothetical protein [Apilactobacillus ozensis]